MKKSHIALWEGGDITPCILILDTRWRRAVDFTALPFYSRSGKESPILVVQEDESSVQCGEEQIFLSLFGFDFDFLVVQPEA
jgi:hypothetical protein